MYDDGGCDSGSDSYDSGSSGFDCSYNTARQATQTFESQTFETLVDDSDDFSEFDDIDKTKTKRRNNMALDFGNNAGAAPQAGGINLGKRVQAGERINLSKQVGAAVTKYAVGMSWNEKAGIVADCDASIILLDEAGNIIPGSNGPNMPKCMCYYGQQELPGVKSYGDNLTGNDAEVQTPTNSDEQIDVDFAMLDPNVAQVVIIATTHSENPDGTDGTEGTPLPFGRVALPVLTIFNNTNVSAPAPLYTFELDEEASIATAVEVAKFYKKGGEWRYVSMADEVGQTGFGLNGIVAKYNIA